MMLIVRADTTDGVTVSILYQTSLLIYVQSPLYGIAIFGRVPDTFYAVVLIGRITGLACPSVCLLVLHRLQKQKHRKIEIGVYVLRSVYRFSAQKSMFEIIDVKTFRNDAHFE